jgi:serine/threonine-protein kinase HipA
VNLTVCLDGVVAGTLVTTAHAQSTFTYDPAWLDVRGTYPLSAAIPLQPGAVTGAAVTNFLWGLLPDNERTLSAWAQEFQVSARNPAALLAHVGEDCAGAVQFVTEERLSSVISRSTRPEQVEWLTAREFEERITRLARDGAAGRASTHEGQFSLAGAQSKTAFYFDAEGGRWGVPRGRTPTTHILKPAVNDFDGFAANEHFCLTLARKVGLAAAATEWRTVGDVPTLIVERYDRVRVGSRWRRIHQEDFCQALDVHPASKYENDGGPGFPQIMSLLDATDDPEADRERLMRGACLIYLLAATDAHAKNFSLLHGRGAIRPSLRLAPFYDIASAWPYPRALPKQKLKLAMRVGKHYRIREIFPRHFLEMARTCRFSPERMREILKELATILPDEAASLAKKMGSAAGTGPILSAIVDGIAYQSAIVLRHLDTPAR